jgi:hypothetical protein
MERAGLYSTGLSDMPRSRGGVALIQPVLVHPLLRLLPHFPAVVVGCHHGKSGGYH